MAGPRRNRARARWAAAALLALSLHALLLAALSSSGALRLFGGQKRAPAAKVNPVNLRSVPRTAWAEHRRVQAEGAPPAEPRLVPPPPIERPPPAGRVVDVAQGNGQKPPEDAKFLAESNNRVEKETVSRHRSLDFKQARPQPTAPAPPAPLAAQAPGKTAAAGNGGRGQEDAPEREAQKRAAPESSGAQAREALALRLDALDGRDSWLQRALRAGRPERLSAAGEGGREEAEGSQGRPGTSALSLTPSAAVLDRIAGAPASDLSARDGVEEGEATFLNTREWKYASFFNRVKRDVGSQWHPVDAVRQADSSGHAAFGADRYTVLAVTLDASGRLEGLRIVQSSGISSLDREAMAAFERAQPFQNPPPGLLNERGDLAFNFGFHVEGDRAGLKLFRPLSR